MPAKQTGDEPPAGRFLPIKGVAEVLGIPYRSAYDLVVVEKAIPATKWTGGPNASWRVSRRHLDEFVQQMEAQAEAEAARLRGVA